MIFLDVGAHEGQTLEEVTKPGYGFSRVIAFEPMPEQFAAIAERYGDAVEVHNCALADFDGHAWMYGTNEHLEASLFSDHADADARVKHEVIVVDAGGFFKELDGPLTVKLNCEGAECAIVRSIIAAGQQHKIARLMIDFDVRKVQSATHEERATRQLLEQHRVPYAASEDVMYGATHQERIAWWLAGKVWPR